MLDTTLFSVSIPVNNTPSESLILSGCRVGVPEDQTYSELDELNYYALNNNDFEWGSVNIEICCENNFLNPYSDFYISCVSIRADSKILCKISRNTSIKQRNYAKVTKEGKIAFGISYYFTSMAERNLLLHCHTFCIEGFVAFKKKTNVYGFMCRVGQSDGEWIMEEGNTYRIYYNQNIDHLCH
ncbi:hypothetical protein SDC9_150204 [bioreactor metagenome]|uniref:Uncharacterized protein n=1 Tax=bioreactor metagenome TaxID=1076179 RepID=A0A645ER27_9ZZZZ|nr:hypothetical protein [Anaerotignum propionicum]MEA5056121.1 hypothetical protein [Anaerotignum propionicum]